MRRLGEVTLWILGGGALTGAAYWAFLNTPESTVGALALSGALALIALSLLAITLNGALAGWTSGVTRGSVRHAVSRIPAIIPAAALVLMLWWITWRATGWVSAHSGQISAWFIARLGWADVSALFTSIDWAGWWLRWIAAPMVALSLLAGSIRRAASPLRLALATLWFLLLVAAPWVYLAPWRPAGLPPTIVEPVFIAAKLAFTALLMSAGIALIIREAARTSTKNTSADYADYAD